MMFEPLLLESCGGGIGMRGLFSILPHLGVGRAKKSGNRMSSSQIFSNLARNFSLKMANLLLLRFIR
jgi:hypothetical protein